MQTTSTKDELSAWPEDQLKTQYTMYTQSGPMQYFLLGRGKGVGWGKGLGEGGRGNLNEHTNTERMRILGGHVHSTCET